jgi:small-conductance mechanosensitive channel
VIENVSSEPATKVTQILGLACTLKAAQLASAVDVLKAVLAADPDLEANSTAFFKDFGDAAYNFAAVLWIKKGADYVGTLSRVNLAMVKALEENGIDLAVPVRFMYTPTKN